MLENVAKPKRRLRKRFTTPPPVIAPDISNHQHLETPQRSAVFAALYICEMKGIPCSLEEINQYFNIPTSTSSRILASGRARRRKNADKAEDIRGTPTKLANSEAKSIATHVDALPSEAKSAQWEDLAYDVGVAPYPEEASRAKVNSGDEDDACRA